MLRVILRTYIKKIELLGHRLWASSILPCNNNFFPKVILYSFFLDYLFIFDCAGSLSLCSLSLVAVSRGYSLVEVCGLLIVVASHCRIRVVGALASLVVAHRHSCLMACGIFPDQGLNRCPLQRQADSLPLDQPGMSLFHILEPYLILSNFPLPRWGRCWQAGSTIPSSSCTGLMVCFLRVDWKEL